MQDFVLHRYSHLEFLNFLVPLSPAVTRSVSGSPQAYTTVWFCGETASRAVFVSSGIWVLLHAGFDPVHGGIPGEFGPLSCACRSFWVVLVFFSGNHVSIASFGTAEHGVLGSPRHFGDDEPIAPGQCDGRCASLSRREHCIVSHFRYIQRSQEQCRTFLHGVDDRSPRLLSGGPFLRRQVLPEIFDRCAVLVRAMLISTVNTVHTSVHGGTLGEFHTFST